MFSPKSDQDESILIGRGSSQSLFIIHMYADYFQPIAIYKCYEIAKAARFCEAVVAETASWIMHHNLRLLRDAARPPYKL
jgi:hypothetical protein